MILYKIMFGVFFWFSFLIFCTLKFQHCHQRQIIHFDWLKRKTCQIEYTCTCSLEITFHGYHPSPNIVCCGRIKCFPWLRFMLYWICFWNNSLEVKCSFWCALCLFKHCIWFCMHVLLSGNLWQILLDFFAHGYL